MKKVTDIFKVNKNYKNIAIVPLVILFSSEYRISYISTNISK